MRTNTKILFLISILTIVALFTSCNRGKNENIENKKANGPVKYGGVFRMNETEYFRSLYPLDVTEVVGFRIANQVYQGLVKFDQKDLSVLPCLAEKWEVNDSATEYTFYLRKGVYFHDDPCFPDGKGRELKAQDFKYCFDRICTADPNNQMFWVFKNKVKGASEYYQSTADKKPLPGGVEGIKVIDDYTLKIILNFPFAPFIKILGHSSCWVYPKEAVEKYGVDMRIHAVGTGPFKIKSIKEGQAVILEKNPKYWEIDEFGNQLPYLDRIKVTFIKEKKAELLEFRKGNLEMIYKLPIEMIDDVVAELDKAKEENIPFQMQNIPAMSLFYYGFQNKSKLFSNKKVRQAFNYAIDKESIVTYTLRGEGTPALHGIVPPIPGYPIDSVKGYEYNPDKARKLLSEAGYPNGKGFPKLTLQINSGGGDRNIRTAEVIQKMLKENLNIEVEINVMPWAQHLDNIETGKAIFWRTGWIADYPDPENFLNLLYGKLVPEKLNKRSYINSVRYQNSEFDKIFEKALRETDEEKRMELYAKADQIAMNDAAMIPLFYDENTRLIQVYVKNFPVNAMEYRDLTKVYFDKEAEQ